MKRIWSPWRIEYIRGEKPDGCILCDKPRENADAENLILYRGEHCYIMMNRYPYNNGHLMVVPYDHIEMPTGLSPGAQMEMMSQMNMCLQTLREAMQPDGFNVGMNLGASAGAGIRDHLHVHIVPRWTGDTSFMPVVGETRVIVEALEACYESLKCAFSHLFDPGGP